MLLKNLLKVLRSPFSMGIGLFVGLLLAFMVYRFTDKLYMIGNFGYTYTMISIALDVVNVILTVLFVAATVWKLRAFGTQNTNHKRGGIGVVMSAIFTGCPACTVTLATYLGVASFLSFLPWGGIEVKMLATVILLYVSYKAIKDLMVCKIKK